MPAAPPRHFLSLEQWRALDEDTSVRWELQEGIVVEWPRPTAAHQQAMMELAVQLYDQALERFQVLPAVEIVVLPDPYATVRVPDIVVVNRGLSDDLDADDVVLVVEVLAPGTRKLDLVMKRSEYADAEIPHYWIVDLEGPRLEVLTLADGAYGSVEVTDVYTTSEPFDVTVDPTRLG